METIYGFFSDLYGSELHDFLLGVNGMNDANLFNLLFIVLFIISAGVIPGMYYKVIDKPTWATFGKWSLVLLINAIIIFLINVIWVQCLNDLMVDEEGDALAIGLTNIIGFGFASTIIASILFFFFSFVWKLTSTNTTSTPF